MAENWKYMEARDAISGTEGTLYAIIDGNVEAVAECKNFNAKITKKKSEFNSLGHRGTQHKATGWSGSGELVLYYATSKFSRMMIEYAKTGVDQYFTLVSTNEDPTSRVGKQTVSIMQVNLDEAEIAKLDTGAEFLDQSLSYTFSDVEMPEEFKGIQ